MNSPRNSAEFAANPSSSDEREIDSRCEPVESFGEWVTPAQFQSSANRPPQRQGTARVSILFPSPDVDPNRGPLHRLHNMPGKPLRIMKFGGTSVGDASCIRRVITIIEAASRTDQVVAVVSAMGGVTNKLIEAATRAAARDATPVASVFHDLREQHEAAALALIHSVGARKCLIEQILKLIDEGNRSCREVMGLRQLTPAARDAIAGLGERLSAPIVAAALSQSGVPSDAIEATELVVTNSRHGAAEPWMDLTRERCLERLGSRLRQGVVPVVTGFIGATVEGIPTTLGRGGSDYSATILGAALDADEIVIWKDVDGVLTADPRFVPDADTIPETSYQEVANLTRFGAKVLHPGTLLPLMKSGIPVWIRNTFAPERSGTRITPEGPRRGAAKVLTSTSDVALITLSQPCSAKLQDALATMLADIAAGRPGLLLVVRSSQMEDTCLVVSSELVEYIVDTLRCELVRGAASECPGSITVNRDIALVTVVGPNGQEAPAMTRRTLDTLALEGVEILEVSQNSSQCSISFVVAREALNVALTTAHREFQLRLRK